MSCFDAWVQARSPETSLLTLAAVIVATVTGCSFVFVDGPPRHAPSFESPPRDKVCTESRLWPIVDSVIAGLEAARAGVALVSSEDTYRKAGLSRSWEAGLGIGFSALFLSSAVYGFVQTHECARYYQTSALVSARPAPARQ